MSVVYPLALPAQGFAGIRLLARDVVGVGESPFSLSRQVQHSGGQRWEADVTYPPLVGYDVAAAVIAFLLSLKGRYGTFLMPADPLRATPRGTWAGSPQVAGAHAAGAAALALDGFTAAATVKAGDYVQVGTGSLAHVHCVLADVTANGGGAATLDIWPNLRAALVDNAAIVKQGPMGVWRLGSNERSWDIGTAQRYGISFVAVEDI